MANTYNRYSGDAMITIKKDGRVVIKTVTEYPSLEAAGVSLTNAEIVNALNKPILLPFPPVIKKTG
jgi:hypothetical protein